MMTRLAGTLRATHRARFVLFALTPFAMLAVAVPAAAATRQWTGAAGDTNWTTAANWMGGVVPSSGDLAQFDAAATTDVTIDANINVAGIQMAADFTRTITQSAGYTVTVGSTGITVNNGTFGGGNKAIVVNGPFSLALGTFTATTDVLSIHRNFTISGGTFNHNNGTVRLFGYDKTVSVAGATLKNLIYDTGGNSITLTDTLNVAGDFTLNSVNYMSSGTLAVAGNVTSNDAALVGYPGTVILINGAGDQTLTAGVANAQVPTVTINKPSGTLTLVGSINVFNHWTHTAGNVDCGAQPLKFVGYDKTVTAGTMTYNDVVYDTGGNSITTSGTMNVSGTFTIKSINYMSGGTIACAGNVVTQDSSLIGYPATVVLFSGTGDQTLSANGTFNEVPSVTINKPSGKLTLADQIGVFNNFTYTAGTVDARAATVKFVGYDKTISAAGMTFGDVVIDTGGNSVTVTGSLTVGGSLTIISVNYFQTGTIYVAGNLTSTDTSINSWQAVTLVLNGTADQLIDTNGGAGKIPLHLTIDKPRCTGGEAKLASHLTLNQSGQKLTLTSGTLNLQGYNLTMSGSAGKLYVKKGGILKLDGSALLTTLAGSPELQCGSMVVVNGGGSYSFPSGTAAQISGVGGNSQWTVLGGCLESDAPAACAPSTVKIVRWREVPN